jgi:hypothetical protein
MSQKTENITDDNNNIPKENTIETFFFKKIYDYGHPKYEELLDIYLHEFGYRGDMIIGDFDGSTVGLDGQVDINYDWLLEKDKDDNLIIEFSISNIDKAFFDYIINEIENGNFGFKEIFM